MGLPPGQWKLKLGPVPLLGFKGLGGDYIGFLRHSGIRSYSNDMPWQTQSAKLGARLRRWPGLLWGVYESLVRILCGFQKQFYTGLAGLGL